jgi:hypothetical protein
MKFDTAPKPNIEAEKKEPVKPEGYDEMNHCPYCGRVMCAMFFGGEICSPPHITNIKYLSLSDIDILRYEYGENEIESIKRGSELKPDVREFKINRLDKSATDIEIEKKRNDAYEQLTQINDKDRERFIAITGINIDSFFTPRERYYISLLLKDKEIEEEKVNNILGFDMKIFMITEYDHSIMKELVDYLQDLIRSKEIKILVRDVLQNFDVFGKLLSNALDQDEELKKKKVEDLAEFSQQIFEALVRKMKDLCLIIIRAKDEETNRKGLVALRSFGKSVAIISNVLSKGTTYKKEMIEMPSGQMPQFLVTDFDEKEYRVKFLVRPKAENGAQARINVEINFDTENPNLEMKEVFYQETEWLNNSKRKGIQKESVFRMGIDLDVDNPLNPGLSLDIGRSAIESEKRIASGETLGNFLASVSPEKTHTPFSFDRKFADPELFERLAKEFEQFLLSKED